MLFMIPMMIAGAVVLTRRVGPSPGRRAPGCECAGRSVRSVDAVAPPVGQDPMVVLRERLARGEIGLPECEARLTGLLRSDPATTMPWWGNPAPVAPSGATR
ncbi:MAG: hypothetical protein NVS3B26_23410 [Mycobacteriales bacterium]